MMTATLPKNIDPRGLYPVTATCKILGICRQTLYNYEQRGLFVFVIREEGRKRPQRCVTGRDIEAIFYNVSNNF